MYKFFPGKRHTSILTQLLCVIAVFGFCYITSAKPVSADCSPKNGACPTGKTFTCSYTTSGGNSETACCSDSIACNSYKLVKSSSATAVIQGKGIKRIDPESGCSNGINTALGCIPYETKGFTASLLGFLAGIVGLIALIVMIIATIMIMTGGNNPEQVKKGKELFTGGITGLFFIIFSVTILRIIAGDIIQLPGF